MTQRPDRSSEIIHFLSRIGWQGAERRFLAGDASFRRYERVEFGDKIAVLMDAPPPWEDVKPFIAITNLLRSLSLNAPRIDAVDEEQGFLLLEDLGDASFTRVLAQDPSVESTLYEAAIDALASLQNACRRQVHTMSLPPYDQAVYLREVALFSDWFMPQAVGYEQAAALRESFLELWHTLLNAHPLEQSVLVHRDYHADNLLWLPERDGAARVGMLDYQDALLGDPFYDVVSLLEDARRDVNPRVAEACFHRFCAATHMKDQEEVMLRYALLGAQRNMKIVGIFTRLCVRDGKPHYLDYLPRVWAHLERDLSHPALAPLQQFVRNYVPVEYQGAFVPDIARGSLT